MMTATIRMVAVALVVLAGTGWATEGGTVERLDLPACVARARDSAPDVATARARLAVREGELQKAKAARFVPEVGTTSSLFPVRGAEGKLDSDLPSEHVRHTGELGPGTRVQLGFVQPIWTAGKITAAINAATAGVAAAIAAADATMADVVEQTKTLYYSVLLARAVENVLGETDDAFRTAIEKARERREQGDASVTELQILNLRVAAAETAKEMPRLRASAETALEALRRLMGYRPDDPVDLKDERLEPVEVDLPPVEQYEAALFDRNPQWRQVSAGVTAKEEEVKRAEAEYYPQLFIRGGLDYGYAPNRRRQTNPFVYDNFNYLRGPGGALAVGWKLSFHMTAAEVATKRAELLTVESERSSARTGLPVQLRQVYRHVVETREQLQELGDGRKAGRAILTFTVANFDLGIGEPADVIQGLGLYGRVSSDYFQAVRDYNLALAALARIMGDTTASVAPSTATR
jgi:outer membrane protein TolC